MSRFFILLLIALLPLRGWTVQSMVVGMGAHSVAHAAQVHSGSLGEDCALHMQQASASGASGADHTTAHKDCQNCQLCMPLVAQAAPEPLALAASAQSLPRLRASHFVSAERARDVKPPIS